MMRQHLVMDQNKRMNKQSGATQIEYHVISLKTLVMIEFGSDVYREYQDREDPLCGCPRVCNACVILLTLDAFPRLGEGAV